MVVRRHLSVLRCIDKSGTARQIVDRDDNPFILSTASQLRALPIYCYDNAGRIYIYSFEESDPGALWGYF